MLNEGLVKYTHLLLVVPLILYVGYQGMNNKKIPMNVSVLMMAVSVIAMFYHMGCFRMDILPPERKPYLKKLFGSEGFKSESKTHIVEIVNHEYRPQHMHVRKGDTVRWINRDTSMHTASSYTRVFDSEEMEMEDRYEFTFEKSGIYNYYCRPHPYMKGTISVIDH